MTTKKIRNAKTILFATIIAAMIIPVSGIQNVQAESEAIVVTGPEPEIQVLLDRSMDPNTTAQEQQQIKKELNALGVPTREQLDNDPEFWSQKVFEKAQKKLFKEQQQDEKKPNTFTTTLENNQSVVTCPNCPPNNNAAFWPGFWYDCGQTYMCSAQSTTWLIVPELSAKTRTFTITFPLSLTGVIGWYYAQGPNGSTNVDWTDILNINPIGSEESRNFDQDIDPSVFKSFLKVNNNPQNSQIKFTYSVHDVT